ncbi:uncharacterized protein LOC129729547 [Wyeomyia smithii]|uniref:uncharacterized protein LOC129729547 n=1 Tax=Wyeomyia smithii TaxID=174621 RepID=UPI002467D48B|nr:uncharacterized protein LOC129729547 [Wyeomyia smithii]
MLMPLEYQIKIFFQCEDLLEKTVFNTTKLEKSVNILNFVAASKWKQIREKYENDVIIPIWLYSDEFGVNDTQSSHSNRHSICGIYYSFPTFPEEFQGKLCNIFVAGMLKKVDIKTLGINKLISALVDKFKELEEVGITFTLNGRETVVRFVLCLVQGDNLGMHTMLHSSHSFNATFYCRFCRRPKELLKRDVKEHADCIRRRQDYNEDIIINQHSEAGISGNSIFNTLPSFHVMENRSVDAMHDIFSNGICKYGFTVALDYFIFEKKYFTVNQFNSNRQNLAKLCLDNEIKRMPDITETYNSKERKKNHFIANDFQ